MKTRLVTVLAGILAMLSLLAPQAGAKPSENDIQSVLKDETALDNLVKDATAVESADVVLRVIKRIQKSSASEAAKKRAIALVVARVVAYKPEQAPEMMAELVSKLNDNALLPVVVSAAVIAAGWNSIAVFDAMAAKFKGDPILLKTITDSANAPVVVLTPPLVKDIEEMIRIMRLAAVPIIPAQEPTTVPLVPPLVAGRYAGQE